MMTTKQLLCSFWNLPSSSGYIFSSLPLLALDHLSFGRYVLLWDMCVEPPTLQPCESGLAGVEAMKGYFNMFSLSSFKILPHKGNIQQIQQQNAA